MSDLSAMQIDGALAAPATEREPDVELPALEEILSANDFRLAAEKALTPKAWAFYSSAATDLVTYNKNRELTRRVMLRPRILRNVSNVSIKRNILGMQSEAPFFMCPAAMATLAHPDGELGWSRAAANEGIFQIVRPAPKSRSPNFGILSNVLFFFFFLDLQQCLLPLTVNHLSRTQEPPLLSPAIRQFGPIQDDRTTAQSKVPWNQSHLRYRRRTGAWETRG